MPHEIAVREDAEELVIVAGHNGSACAYVGHDALSTSRIGVSVETIAIASRGRMI